MNLPMKKSKLLKKENNPDPSLIKFTQDLICISQKIEKKISEYRLKDSLDDDFFIYHFFQRTLKYAQSIILLIQSQHYHEGVIIARNILEGMFYFQAYIDDTSISQKWRLYCLYEDYRKAIINQGEGEAEQLLSEYEKIFGKEKIEEIKKMFDFGEKIQNWHKAKNIRKLIKNPDLKNLYNVYHDFSQVTHWTPTGVIGGSLNINASITVSFQGLYQISKFVNDKYKLQFENDLKMTYKNYTRYHAV